MVLILAALTPLPEIARMVLLAFGLFGVIAPLYAVFALPVALGLAWMLARKGWLGWLPAVFIGLGTGAAAALLIGGNSQMVLVLYAGISGLALRATLAR